MILTAAAPALPGVFATLAPALDSYGYLAVGALLFLEDFGVPVPGETMLIAAAVYAGTGRLNIALVVVVGVVAALLGDNLGYLIGRRAGRPAVLRWGRYVRLTEERLGKAEGFFARHGGKVVTIARFIEGLRQVNGIIAGLSGMAWQRFLVFNALGAVLWVSVWSAVGYLAGSHLQAVYETISRFSLYLVAAAVVVAVGLLVRRRMTRSRAAAP